MLNVITAKFCSGATQTWTDEAYQWDYGQVLQFDGLELPDAYEVHFSNTPMSGETITQIGGADGVSVPDQFFLSGSAVYAWVFLHEGEDDGETVYMVTIPVKKRPQPSDDVPTPVEQSAIDQAIAALNVAVDKAEDAIEHYPRIQDGTWWVWDVTTETWADTGVQAQGRPGTDGTDGDDGFSPVITVTDITGGHRVTITDAEGTQTVDVLNGQQGTPGTNGTDGYSPTVTVTQITGGHRVTITDAQGSHVFDVMDGSDASVTVDSELSDTSENPVQNKVITGAVNQINEDITDLHGEVDGKVDDVQVNGTSVVTDGVANIPQASVSNFGLVKVANQGNTNGIQFNTNGVLEVYPSSDADVKAGSATRKPISPATQHRSVFYGLAKASGDTSQSASSNSVGQYTDAAKVAIQKMLGIYEAPWELIREDTFTNAEEADHVITVDGNGNPFELTDVIFLGFVPDHDQDTNIGDYGKIYFYDGSTEIKKIYLLNAASLLIPANSNNKMAVGRLTQNNGLMLIDLYVWANTLSRLSETIVYMMDTNSSSSPIDVRPLSYISKIKIGKITGQMQYRLLGRRRVV